MPSEEKKREEERMKGDVVRMNEERKRIVEKKRKGERKRSGEKLLKQAKRSQKVMNGRLRS